MQARPFFKHCTPYTYPYLLCILAYSSRRCYSWSLLLCGGPIACRYSYSAQFYPALFLRRAATHIIRHAFQCLSYSFEFPELSSLEVQGCSMNENVQRIKTADVLSHAQTQSKLRLPNTRQISVLFLPFGSRVCIGYLRIDILQ